MGLEGNTLLCISEMPRHVVTGAVLALAVLVVSLLAEGSSQREVRHSAGTQDS